MCTLIGSICWKYIYKTSAKKYRGVMSHDTEEWCKISRKTDLLFQKWQEFGEFRFEHSKVSKIWTLIGSFCEKYITSDLSNLPLRLAPPFQLVGSLGRCAHPRDFQLLCLENRENPPHFLGKFVTSKRRRSPKAWINGRFHSGNSITLQNGY